VLTLPSELLKPGQAAELAVQGDGAASLRWLAIDPYANTAAEAAKIQ